jgi:hypothetical protein
MPRTLCAMTVTDLASGWPAVASAAHELRAALCAAGLLAAVPTCRASLIDGEPSIILGTITAEGAALLTAALVAATDAGWHADA